MIELVVVTGILVIISSIILANNSKFGGVVTLRNLAYDIALSVREAQTYGIAVRRFGSDDFGSGYGIHIPGASSPTTYLIFADANDNELYDASGGELVDLITIGRGFVVGDICATPATGSPTEQCGLQRVDIVFKRPEPDALIHRNGLGDLNRSARIILRSPRGDEASVLIEATGQISVQ